MSMSKKSCVTIYTRYERFWHWSQAALIFALAFSGFNIHGSFSLLDFQTAVMVHTISAILLIVLWIFTTFWNFTTGNWKQFLPFLDIRAAKGDKVDTALIFILRLFAVARYYAWGILRGEEHPFHKTLRRKQNALQALSYLTFMVVIGPALWASGIVYLLYDLWNTTASAGTILMVVAFVHTAAAFLMVAFVIVHVYMTTTGSTPMHYIMGMITGVEEIELTEVERAYLEQDYPERLQNDKNPSC